MFFISTCYLLFCSLCLCFSDTYFFIGRFFSYHLLFCLTIDLVPTIWFVATFFAYFGIYFTFILLLYMFSLLWQIIYVSQSFFKSTLFCLIYVFTFFVKYFNFILLLGIIFLLIQTNFLNLLFFFLHQILEILVPIRLMPMISLQHLLHN